MKRRISRRQFLVGAAAAGVAAVSGSAFVINQSRDSDEVADLTATPDSVVRLEPNPAPSETPDPTREPTAVPTPSPSPDPGPEPDPTPTIVMREGLTIQQLVDRAEPGSTVVVPAEIYRETVYVDKPLTLIAEPGAEIRGDDESGNIVREHWLLGRSDGVTIDGFVMRYAGNAAQSGAIANRGHSNWTIRNCRLSHAAGANVSLTNAANVTLSDCEITDAGQLGVHGTGTVNALIRNCRIVGNHAGGFDPVWEAGGLKFTQSTGLVVEGCEVAYNLGPGLWTDIDCFDTIFRGNRVHHNDSYGINNEVSGRCLIFDNVVYENGYGHPSWAWGAGILLQNAQDGEVFDNIVAWNVDGISVISQDRSHDWPDWNQVANNHVYRNSLFLVASSDTQNLGLAWIQDWDGEIDNPEFLNRGSQNRYFHINPSETDRTYIYGDSAFRWDDLDGFNSTLGEDEGRYLDDEEMRAILGDAGVPLEPERL